MLPERAGPRISLFRSLRIAAYDDHVRSVCMRQAAYDLGT
jgi:hypothetical protein